MSYPQLILGIMLLLALNGLAEAQSCNGNILETAPNTRYTVNSDETVLDKKTGLIWKRCSEGFMLSSGACVDDTNVANLYTWQQALERANTVNTGDGFAGSRNWRVPNIKELLSLHEERCVGSAANEQVFPNAQSYFYWSSSPDAGSILGAWAVAFYEGFGIRGNKSLNSYVRLVRSGQ